MVFIMPGMENFAPERTLTSSGFSGSPSFLPICASSFFERFQNLIVDLLRNLVAVLEVDVADFGGDGESRRHGNARAAHLGKAGAFAAEDIFHLAVAIGVCRRRSYKRNFSFLLSCGNDLREVGDRGKFRKNIVKQGQAVGADVRVRGVHQHFVEETVDVRGEATRCCPSAV